MLLLFNYKNKYWVTTRLGLGFGLGLVTNYCIIYCYIYKRM